MNSRPIVALDAINFEYGGARKVAALTDITFSVSQGEFVSISGPSGSGKSTLMNILGCMLTPTSGSYQLNNEEVSRKNSREKADIRNTQIGFVFQNYNLLPRASALQNVCLPLTYGGFKRRTRKERAIEVLTKVGLEKRIHHHSNELSGGEQQRVAIARAIVTNPQILLADEPTGNLDRATGDNIMDMLENLVAQEQMTILFVTHDPDMVKRAKRSIKIRDSKIAGDEAQ